MKLFPPSLVPAVFGRFFCVTWARVKDLRQNGKEEGGRLSRSGLRARHQIPLPVNDWDRVFLDWGGNGVAGEFNRLFDNGP